MCEPLIELLSRQLIKVRGDSMAPTLRDGQWVVVSRRAYARRLPARFDVVRFIDPRRPASWSVKRIVGLPSELVELRGNELVTIRRATDEPGSAPANGADYSWMPGPGEYIVLGDNRRWSTDSREYGPIGFSAITGAVRGHAKIG